MECTCFREYVRLVNLRRWVSDGLKAYDIVINELANGE